MSVWKGLCDATMIIFEDRDRYRASTPNPMENTSPNHRKKIRTRDSVHVMSDLHDYEKELSTETLPAWKRITIPLRLRETIHTSAKKMYSTTLVSWR